MSGSAGMDASTPEKREPGASRPDRAAALKTANASLAQADWP